jgi:hypothetical protein
VTLDESDNGIGSAAQSPVAFVEHGVGLADARRGAQVDPETPGRLYRTTSIRVRGFACRHLIAHVFQSGSGYLSRPAGRRLESGPARMETVRNLGIAAGQA